ncbi:hypothetical protein PPERSA_00780 [Pseudocohnilembus persalinus]|uniref:RING-type E3 ubiquitin transferase n=1 Tax=Pseudocohnilembus persalinus TaxID=266149 RepID=A0A0V0Q9N8_PSEPJ|nr:hypothetical protein PPERSA_00780 [Pseudocohnilembus persalinus]|eukprot:KRW98953.1 hypothetical protein PPERSA_00780 [Pseudocohnilembus persalinus]
MSYLHQIDHEEEEKKQNQFQAINMNNQQIQQNQNQQEDVSNQDDEQMSLKQKAEQFECHICFEIANEPVITPCGHMFCWSCIYTWLNSNQQFLSCPVCKNGIKQEQLISVYTKQDFNEGVQQLKEQYSLKTKRVKVIA